MTGILFWVCVLAVFYVYAGYPLVLVAIARLRKPAEVPADPPHRPAVTLLIAAYNEQAVVAGKLDNSLACDYPADRLQIIVAADGSDDQTVSIVEGYADRGVILSYSPERLGKSAAINRAMGLAEGEIVIFSDANNHYEPQTLSQLVQPFADQAVGAVSGAKVIRSEGDQLGEAEGAYWKYESFIKRQETRLGSCTAVAGEILAVRRELVATIPGRVINDDFYLAMWVLRRGFRIVYEPGARSVEGGSLTERDEAARRARIVAGRYQAMLMSPRTLPWFRPVVVWQVLSHKFARPLVPIFMIGALIANLIAVVWPTGAQLGVNPGAHPGAGDCGFLSLADPYNWIALGVQGLFYITALLGSVVKGSGVLARLVYVPRFLVSSNLSALIGLLRFVSGRQTPIWQRVRRQEEG